ncbi:MAG: UDP-N-acetylglucosamine 4-epimerase [Acidobacteria bacterium]|nr:UDP-N-acetylglucosamine 4-epimerase [Acidobacteriota bacterium]
MTARRKQFLVTGGAGFIGSHLVDRLLAQNPARVVVIDNFDEFYDPQIKRANIAAHLNNQAYRLVEADIRDYAALKQIFSEQHFDAIIHLAAKAGVRPSVSDPRTYTEVNINGTMNLLDLAERNGIKKFIFGSSSSVYGPAAIPPFKEDAPLAPISPYAATKASGELLAHTYSHLYGMQIVCLRFFTVYGARQRPDLAIHKFARLISSRSPIQVYGDGGAERDFTYINDILQGVLAAIEYDSTPFEIINLGESQTITVNRMIELLEEALGQKAIIEYRSPQPGDMPRTHADISKARALLGYQPATPIEAGIKKFAEWFKRGAKS